MAGDFKQNVRDFNANWRESELPVTKRTLRAVKNLSKRFLGRDCCGHHNEPGC